VIAQMENQRTNEVLAEQIAIIQEFAPKLATDDLRKLEENLEKIQVSLNKLKEFIAYLPK
jgi:hypothetical protein